MESPETSAPPPVPTLGTRDRPARTVEPNLLANGDFSQRDRYWRLGRAKLVELQTKGSGRGVLFEVDSRADAPAKPRGSTIRIVSDPMPLRAGETLTIRLAARVERSAGHGLNFEMEFFSNEPRPGADDRRERLEGARPVSVFRGFGKKSVTTGWVTLRSDGVAVPEGVSLGRLSVTLRGAPGDRVLVDEIAVVENRLPAARRIGFGVPAGELRAAVETGGAEAVTTQATGNATRIAVANAAGDASPEVVYARFDGGVSVHPSPSGDVIWTSKTQGYPFDLATFDLDDDGRSEVLVADASGQLSALGEGGRTLWTFDAGPPLYQVAAAHVAGHVWVLTGGVDGNLHVLDAGGRHLASLPIFDGHTTTPVRHLRAANFDDDADDEVVVSSWQGEIALLDPPSLEALWHRKLLRASDVGPESSVEPRFRFGGRLLVGSMNVADLDRDGRSEILVGTSLNRVGGDVQILGSDGRLRLRIPGDVLQDRKSPWFTQDAVSLAVPLFRKGQPWPVLAVLMNNRISLFDVRGIRLGASEAGVGFNDMAVAPPSGGPPTVHLASTPNGDDQIYSVAFGRGWEKKLAKIERAGRMRRIAENIETLERQIDRYEGRAKDEPVYLHTIDASTIPRSIETRGRRAKIDKFRDLFRRYRNLEYAVTVRGPEIEPVSGFRQEESRKSFRASREDILRAVDAIEKAGTPTWYIAAHSNHPQISLELANAILERCPNACLGFEISESIFHIEGWEKYFGDYVIPLIEICKKHGKKLNWLEKTAGVFWVVFPAMAFSDRIFSGEFADTLVVNVENSNVRSPELNLSGMLGLELSGAVGTVAVRSIKDDPRFNPEWDSHPTSSAHPFLRKQVAYALAGARFFDYNLPIPSARIDSYVQDEMLFPLLHMLGKGLLVPPQPKDMLNVARVAIVTERPNPRMIDDTMGEFIKEFAHHPEERRSPFEGLATYWGAAPSRPHYVGSYLMGVERHALNHIPSTPYGIVAIVPERRYARASKFFDAAWKTDLYYFHHGGREMDGVEARDAVHASFAGAALELPYRAEGRIFMQAQRMNPSTDRITLVDPGFLDPDDRRVTLHFQAKRVPKEMVDLLSRERFALGRPGMKIELTVPAGVLRILEVRY